MDSKYKYLAKNTLLFTISSFGSKILIILLVPLYTRFLSTEEYGIADFITTTAMLLIYILTLDIYDAVMRFAIDKKEHQEKYLKYAIEVLIGGSLILCVGLFICYAIGIFNFNKTIYIFLFIQFVSYALNQILGSFLRAVDKVKEVAISGIVTTVVVVVLNLILLIGFKMGLNGYLISMVSGNIVSSIYCLFVIRDRIPSLIKCKADKQTRVEMRQYSIPLIFNGVAWWMNSSIDKYFIIGLLGQSLNGIYSISQKIPMILSTFHSIFSQAWNLSAIKEYDKDDKSGFFLKTYTTYNAVLVIVCSGLILINIPVSSFLFAKEFFVGWKTSSILLLSTLFSSLSGFVGSIFSAVKETKIYAVSTVTTAVINCVLNVIFIPWIGIIGAAIATAVSFFITLIIRLICARKYIVWNYHITKDLIAYGLLVAQIVFEHTTNHGYLGQIIVFAILLLLYFKQIIGIVLSIIQKMKANFKNVCNRRKEQ